MRLIVSGGTGFIGRALVGDALKRGDEVFVLTRNPSQVSLPAKAEVRAWDGSTVGPWAEIIDANSAIVNLAGEGIADGNWTTERKRRIRESRVDAGLAISQAIAQAAAKPRVLVQASAVGYYGPRGPELVTEEQPPGRDFLANVCVDWEKSSQGAESQGVRRVIVRTGVVLSRDGGALPRMLLPFRFFAGGPLGSGRQGFPWIHLADEVGAILFLIDNPNASGAFNLAAPELPTNLEFSRALGRAMRRPAILPTPALALRLIFGEMATVLLDGQRATPARLEGLGYRFRFRQSEAALRAIL